MKKHTKVQWSPSIKQQCVDEYRKGDAIGDIARKHGIRYGTVHTWCRYGINGNGKHTSKPSDVRQAELTEYLDSKEKPVNAYKKLEAENKKLKALLFEHWLKENLTV